MIAIDESMKIIIRTFAVLTKSNNVLMSDFLSKNARKNLMNIVSNFRKHYQFLLKISAKAFDRNPRSKSATSNQSRAAISNQSRAATSIDIDMRDDITQRITVRSERVKIYRNDQKRLNVHTALHYDLIKNEYELSSNCNVLIEEDKHRYYFHSFMFICILLCCVLNINSCYS